MQNTMASKGRCLTYHGPSVNDVDLLNTELMQGCGSASQAGIPTTWDRLFPPPATPHRAELPGCLQELSTMGYSSHTRSV